MAQKTVLDIVLEAFDKRPLTAHEVELLRYAIDHEFAAKPAQVGPNLETLRERYPDEHTDEDRIGLIMAHVDALSNQIAELLLPSKSIDTEYGKLKAAHDLLQRNSLILAEYANDAEIVLRTARASLVSLQESTAERASRVLGSVSLTRCDRCRKPMPYTTEDDQGLEVCPHCEETQAPF